MLTFFQKRIDFYPTPKKWGGLNHDFFGLLNVLVGVHESVENLLTRICIRDSTFCDEFLQIFRVFRKIEILEN